jgi:hypothetical protein
MPTTVGAGLVTKNLLAAATRSERDLNAALRQPHAHVIADVQ